MIPKPTIQLKAAEHRKQKVICYYFNYDQALISVIKQLPGARWSASKRCWYQNRDEFKLHTSFEALKDIAWLDYSAIKNPNSPPSSDKKTTTPKDKYTWRKTTPLPDGYMQKLEQKRYSESTIQTYSAYMKDFVYAFREHELTSISPKEINNYILRLIQEEKISTSQQNQRINAIKFYYEKVLGLEKMYFEIDRPRHELHYPEVLSKNEIYRIIQSTDNLKHKCLIMLIYSCGLRRSEAINIKLNDINSKRQLLMIRQAKGNKDRSIFIPDKTMAIIKQYYRTYKPYTWLFEGKNQCQYSATSIGKVIKRSALNVGIKRRVYPHILRHSFATHHLEQGTDLRYIQLWLGHASSKTTDRYTHVSNSDFSKFKNPIDDL